MAGVSAREPMVARHSFLGEWNVIAHSFHMPAPVTAAVAVAALPPKTETTEQI